MSSDLSQEDTSKPIINSKEYIIISDSSENPTPNKNMKIIEKNKEKRDEKENELCLIDSDDKVINKHIQKLVLAKSSKLQSKVKHEYSEDSNSNFETANSSKQATFVDQSNWRLNLRAELFKFNDPFALDHSSKLTNCNSNTPNLDYLDSVADRLRQANHSRYKDKIRRQYGVCGPNDIKLESNGNLILI